MKSYARMEAGVAAELFETDGDMAQMFHPSIVWIEVTGVSPAPQVGWSFAAGTWSPPQVSRGELGRAFQAAAFAALTKSDLTILRCAERGVPVPASWATYRATLRAIVSDASGAPGTLPEVPAYP